MTTSSDAGDDLLQILDELDRLITGARSVPMSSSAIVNRDDALALIDRARHAVPSAVRRAEEIVADADAVLADGREESERIVLHAQEEAERLVAGESVVRMAHERADEIVAAAEDRAAATSVMAPMSTRPAHWRLWRPSSSRLPSRCARGVMSWPRGSASPTMLNRSPKRAAAANPGGR